MGSPGRIGHHRDNRTGEGADFRAVRPRREHRPRRSMWPCSLTGKDVARIGKVVPGTDSCAASSLHWLLC